MLSLGFVSFLVGGCIFLLYAFSFRAYVQRKIVSGWYPLAFYFLGAAFLSWSVGMLAGSVTSLALSVLAGNVLILLGTASISLVLFNNKALASFTVLAAIAFSILRAVYFFPTPFIQGGILIFNTQAAVAVAYALVFICVWLPANLKVGKQLGNRTGFPDFAFLLKTLFAISTFAAAVLPAAKTLPVVAGAFATIVVCYGALLAATFSLRNFKR